jgi:fatty-acyl-CoA synthase
MAVPSAGMLLADITSRGATLFGDRPAVVTAGRTMSHRDLRAGTCRFISMLDSAGVGPGTRVAVLAANSAEFLQALFAASSLGAVIVPLNSRLRPDDIRFQLTDSGASHALVDDSLGDLAKKSGLLDRTHWFIGEDPVTQKVQRAVSPATPSDSCVARTAQPGDPVVQLYTSGTTGRPKGCLLTQAGWLAANANLAHRFGLCQSDVLLGVYPLFHVAGLGLAMAHLMVGGRVVFPTGIDPDTLWSTIERHRVTVAGLPGLSAALEWPGAAAAARSVRILFGGANMESSRA